MASTIKDVLTQGYHPGTGGGGEKFIPTLGFLSSSSPPPSGGGLPTGGGSSGDGSGDGRGGGKITIHSKRRLKRPFSMRFR